MLDLDNTVIAGGVFSDLHGRAANIADVDLFLYGLSTEEATAKCEAILDQLYAYTNAIGDSNGHKESLLVLQGRYVLRAFVPVACGSWNGRTYYVKRELQIVLRVFPSPHHLLTGFDIGPSGVGLIDGRELRFTNAAAVAFANHAQLVDSTRFSPTFYERLSKYAYGWKEFSSIYPFKTGSRTSREYFTTKPKLVHRIKVDTGYGPYSGECRTHRVHMLMRYLCFRNTKAYRLVSLHAEHANNMMEDAGAHEWFVDEGTSLSALLNRLSADTT